MARRIAISQISNQPSVITRSATGLATSFHATKRVNAPAIYRYGVGYEIFEQWPTKAWALVLQDEDTLVDASVVDEPGVKIMPAGWTVATVFNNAQANNVNAALADTDIGVTVSAGESVYNLLNKILVALGHTPGAADHIVL